MSCGRLQGKEMHLLSYRGGLLLTSPNENERQQGYIPFRNLHHDRDPTTTYGTTEFASTDGVGSINSTPGPGPHPLLRVSPPAAHKTSPLATDTATTAAADIKEPGHHKSKVV